MLVGKRFDLTLHHDSTTVLENPDKGWYYHFLDNGMQKYLIKQDSDLDNIPGMRQLYLRSETFAVNIPSDLPAGDNSIKLQMQKPGLPETGTISLALDASLKDQSGFYTIGNTSVKGAATNQTRKIELNVIPTYGDAPLQVQLDASGSTDADNDDLSYDWIMGDATVKSDAVVSHIFSIQNRYHVILNVTDGHGGLAQAVQEVQRDYTPPPINQMPQLKLSIDKQSGDVPSTVNFDASASSDPDGDALSFTWDFGDSQTGTGKSVSHTYEYIGEYTASLVVDDGHDIYNDQKINLTLRPAQR